MPLCRAASRSRAIRVSACLTVMIALGGCGSRYSEAVDVTPAAPAVPAVVSRGSPLPPPAAQVLEHGPAGARLDYAQPSGVPVAVVLGPPYQSGLQVPCRVGRPRIGVGAKLDAFVFCRQGDAWYAMPPVVISGL